MKIIISKDKNNQTIIDFKKTDISEALEDTNSKKIIIFDEINNASLPVLDLLTNIMVDKEALLPDGQVLKVNNLKIIGIINRNNNENLLDKIPLNLKSNCIYHIVQNPDEKDIINIINKLFSFIDYDENYKKDYVKNYIKNHESENVQINNILGIKEELEKKYEDIITLEFNNFIEKFIKSLKIVQENLIEEKFNLIDARKYIDFRKKIPQVDALYLMLLFLFIDLKIQKFRNSS